MRRFRCNISVDISLQLRCVVQQVLIHLAVVRAARNQRLIVTMNVIAIVTFCGEPRIYIYP
jgi:hypothetical protein